MLRGAMIGFGNVAAHGHVPGWLGRPDVEIVAVSDTNEARRAEADRLIPHACWYDSVETLLAKECLDFVDICTPPSSHVDLIRAALQRGVHVLCEKPLVTSPEDLAVLSSLAASERKVLYTVHNWRQAPIVQFVQDLLRQDSIGEVSYCRWQTLRMKPAAAGDGQTGNWRVDPSLAGGGILVDHGWHVFSLLHGWFGAAPVRISARLERKQHTQYSVEDTASVQLQFPHAAADVYLTWAADRRKTCAELEGTRGTIRVEDSTVLLTHTGPHGAERRWTFSPALSEGSHHPEWFGDVATGFLTSMKDQAIRRANLADASLCVTLIALAQESDRKGSACLPVASGTAEQWTEEGAGEAECKRG